MSVLIRFVHSEASSSDFLFYYVRTWLAFLWKTCWRRHWHIWSDTICRIDDIDRIVRFVQRSYKRVIFTLHLSITRRHANIPIHIKSFYTHTHAHTCAHTRTQRCGYIPTDAIYACCEKPTTKKTKTTVSFSLELIPTECRNRHHRHPHWGVITVMDINVVIHSPISTLYRICLSVHLSVRPSVHTSVYISTRTHRVIIK